MKRKAISRQKRGSLWLILILFFVPAFKASGENILLSEIMYDVSGTDSGHEWLEFYNFSDQTITASSSWRFFDGSNHSINLFYGSSTIPAQSYFILADNGENFVSDYPDFDGILFDTVMSLPNSSSSIGLSFDSGQTYELMSSYSSAWGANGNGYSLEKIELNQNNEANNWQEAFVLGGTPGFINSTSSPEVPPEEDDFSESWADIIISEFLPDPEGSDDNEWIELYNRGVETVNLSGFSLQDNSTRRFTIDEDTDLNLEILSGAYFILPKEISGISLNNSGGDSVKLYNPSDQLQETIEYDSAIEGRSYARQENNFVWTKNPTPGTANEFIFNQAPIAQISVEGDFLPGEKLSFSAEGSFDPDGDELDYLWNFGDGNESNKKTIKHQFDKVGSYTVYLKITDEEGADGSTAFSLDIKDLEKEVEVETQTEIKNIPKPIDLAEDDLIISEFESNPAGSDDNEWIELYNQSDNDIDLSDWYLDDADGGSKPYRFSSTTIASRNFLVIKRQDSKISLNNSNDSVRLLTPSQELWQEVAYEKIPEANSYAWDFENKEWMICQEPSPGWENKTVSTLADNKEIYFVAEAKDLEAKQNFLIQGVAINSVKEATRSLYLADYQSGEVYYDELLEIYSYYKDFPKVSAGQVLTASGEISQNADLPRLKIKNSADVFINDIKIDLPPPEIMDVGYLDDSFLGSVIKVRGTVVKKSGKNIYLAPEQDDDYVLRVYTDFDNKDLEIKKGNEVTATGILSATDNNFKLSVFEPANFSVSQAVLGEKIVDEIVTSDYSTSTEIVAQSNRKSKTKNIIIFIVISVFVLGLIYYFKQKANK